MIPYSAIITVIELVLITTLGGAGAYAFNASSVYEAIREYGAAHNQEIFIYLPLLVWGAITAFGILNIVIRNRGSGVFTWLVVIFTLPSLLGQNTVDWPGILGMNFKLTTSLGSGGMLVVGVFIITGYIVLDYFRVFKESEHSMSARQVTLTEIENVSSFSYVSLLTALAGALTAITLVAFLARGLELLTIDIIRKLPWNVVFIGLFCFLLLAFYIYWLSARRRDKAHKPKDISSLFQ